MDLGHAAAAQTFCCKARVELPGPQHVDAADGECPTDERPVGLDEAEDASYRERITHDACDQLDLLDDSLDQLRLVPGADLQTLALGRTSPPSTTSAGRLPT